MNVEWLHVELVLNVQKTRRRIWTLKGPTSKNLFNYIRNCYGFVWTYLCSTSLLYRCRAVARPTFGAIWAFSPFYVHSMLLFFLRHFVFWRSVILRSVISTMGLFDRQSFHVPPFYIRSFNVQCRNPLHAALGRKASWVGEGADSELMPFLKRGMGRGREMEMTTTQTSASRPHANFTRCEKIAFYSAKIHDHFTNWLITKGHNNTAYVLL